MKQGHIFLRKAGLLSHRAGLAAWIIAICLSFAMPVAAQETSRSAIDEITVTATKRAESIQSVGLSISAVSGTELQQRGAAGFEDYALSIPNLAFGATDDGVLSSRTISIRGIEGINTTGFYIDDVPLEESINPLVLDVERVEVLRGPQGTLYGARGLGGTIRIITKQPEPDEFSGRIHIGLSSTEEGGMNYVTDGAINIPLSDKAALRILGYNKYDEGVFDKQIGPSLTAPGVVGTGSGALTGDLGPIHLEDIDDSTISGGQLSLLWMLSDKLELQAKVLMQKTKLDGFPLADFTYDASAKPQPVARVLQAGDFTQNRLFNIPEFAEDEWLQYSLNLTYETDFGTFSSSTGIFDRETFEGEDTSAFVTFSLPLGLADFGVSPPMTALTSPIYQRLDFETFTEELRFVSDFDGAFQLTAGLFYQDTDDNEAFDPPNYAKGAATAFSPVPVPDDLIFTSKTEFAVEERGLYAELSYDVSDRLAATIGGRWYDVEKTVSYNYKGFAAGGNPIQAPITDSEDGVNLKALVEYQANDDLYLYASFAEGYRLGGFNGPLPASFMCPAQYQAQGFTEAQTKDYESDSLESLEIGVKSTLAGGRITLNGALFSVDFEDIQQRILLGCGFSFTTNAGNAESQGFEVEVVALLGDSWKFAGAIGHTDAELTSNVGTIFSPGDKLQHVPEWTYSASLEGEFDIIGNRQGFVRLDYSYVDDSISRTVTQSAIRQRPSYDILNLRAGLRNEGFEFYAFIDNATDEDAVFGDNRTLAAEAGGRPRLVRNRPRTMGIGFRNAF